MKNGSTPWSRRTATPPDPDFLAIQALTFIAGDPDHAGRFLALTGIGPGEIQHAAADPAFLVGVMDYVVGDEPLLLRVAAEAGVPPEAVVAAHERMTRR